MDGRAIALTSDRLAREVSESVRACTAPHDDGSSEDEQDEQDERREG